MIQPAIDLDALHAAMRTALRSQFPTARVEFYDRPGERIATPAILIELEDIQAGEPDETGTEQLPVNLNFNAYAVLDYKAGQKQAVKTFAAAIMAFVRGKKWGMPVTAASIGSAQPDVISSKEDAYEVMRIEFSHEALLGLDVWRLDHEDSDGEPLPAATDVFVSGGIDGEPLDEPIQIAPCGCNES